VRRPRCLSRMHHLLMTVYFLIEPCPFPKLRTSKLRLRRSTLYKLCIVLLKRLIQPSTSKKYRSRTGTPHPQFLCNLQYTQLRNTLDPEPRCRFPSLALALNGEGLRFSTLSFSYPSLGQMFTLMQLLHGLVRYNKAPFPGFACTGVSREYQGVTVRLKLFSSFVHVCQEIAYGRMFLFTASFLKALEPLICYWLFEIGVPIDIAARTK